MSEDSMDSFHGNNIDDLLEEREWKMRNQANWVRGEGEEFLGSTMTYLHLQEGGYNLGRENQPFNYLLGSLLHHHLQSKKVKTTIREMKEGNRVMRN